jgi:hypothetical protein
MPFEIRFIKDDEEEDTWPTPSDIRKLLPKAKWTHNRLLEEIDVAAEMGQSPSWFWGQSRQDQAFILARFRVKRTLEAYEMELSKKASK